MTNALLLIPAYLLIGLLPGLISARSIVRLLPDFRENDAFHLGFAVFLVMLFWPLIFPVAVAYWLIPRLGRLAQGLSRTRPGEGKKKACCAVCGCTGDRSCGNPDCVRSDNEQWYYGEAGRP